MNPFARDESAFLYEMLSAFIAERSNIRFAQNRDCRFAVARQPQESRIGLLIAAICAPACRR